MPYKYLLEVQREDKQIDVYDLSISDCDSVAHYNVTYRNQGAGYLFIKSVDADNGTIVWSGNTKFLESHANEIGMYIEDCDM